MKKKLIVSILILLFGLTPGLYSQGNNYPGQARFLYNFSREVEWPANSKAGSFVIQVYGSDTLFNELKNYLQNKMVVNQSIQLLCAKQINEVVPCQLLFVGRKKAAEIPSILKRTGGFGMLLVTDQNEGVLNGAAISIVERNDHLFYEISTDNLLKAGLKYSSDLVDLAIDIPLNHH